MKTLKFFFSFLFLSFSLFCLAQTKTEKFNVAGECGTCKKKIEKAAKSAGATYAVWNTDSKALVVKYASTSTNKAKIEQAIAAAGGDAVVALLTALARNAELEWELALSRAAVSNGFSRGWHKARP